MHAAEKFYFDRDNRMWLVSGHGTELATGKRDVWLREIKFTGETKTIYFKSGEYESDEPLDMEEHGLYPGRFPEGPQDIIAEDMTTPGADEPEPEELPHV